MSSQQSPAFKGGFSFPDNIVGKPTCDCLQGLMLGDWLISAPDAQPQHLLDAVAMKGYAVTPARWSNGYKSKKKGRFLDKVKGYISLQEKLKAAANIEAVASIAKEVRIGLSTDGTSSRGSLHSEISGAKSKNVAGGTQ